MAIPLVMEAILFNKQTMVDILSRVKLIIID